MFSSKFRRGRCSEMSYHKEDSQEQRRLFMRSNLNLKFPSLLVRRTTETASRQFCEISRK